MTNLTYLRMTLHQDYPSHRTLRPLAPRLASEAQDLTNLAKTPSWKHRRGCQQLPGGSCQWQMTVTTSCLQGDAFNKEATWKMPPSPVRHIKIGFHQETTPEGGERHRSFATTPPRRKTMPKGAVATGTDTGRAGLSSELPDTKRPNHELQTTHGYRRAAAPSCQSSDREFHHHRSRRKRPTRW
jgi:hypothetical protein